MPQFVNLHFERQEELTDHCFLKSNSQQPLPEPVLFVLLCTSCLGVEFYGTCNDGMSRGYTEREGISQPLGCLVVGVKLWFPFSLLWQSMRPPWKIRQAPLEPGQMVQTQENSPLCLSALRTWGAVRTSPQAGAQAANRLGRDAGGSLCLGPQAEVLSPVGSCSAITCQHLPWGAGADGPVSCECPGAGRRDALCGGGGAGIWVCAECQPTPPHHRGPSLQTGSPAGQAVEQLPLPLWEGGIGPWTPGLRRPLGAGLCAPRCCLEVGSL